MEQLYEKLSRTLRRAGVQATIERVLNDIGAVLPHDEFMGDMLRDGEEVIVTLRGEDGKSSFPIDAAAPASALQTGGGRGLVCSARAGAPTSKGIVPITAMVEMPTGESDESSSDEEQLPAGPQVVEYPPPPVFPRGSGEGSMPIPGPSEEFEIEAMPRETMFVEHPCEPIAPATYDNDFLHENLTPKLRQFVLEHFQEDLITEPKYVPSIKKFVGSKFYQACGSFVTVFMRPQVVVGSDPGATLPVHYNVAKSDILTFQHKSEGQMERAEEHLELFAATMRGLRSLLVRGMSESDHINVMLPHSYQAFEESEGVMMEADRPLFPKIDGSRPVIIIDTSGPAGKHLPFVKAALKRALHAQLASCAAFQFIRFAASGGEPHLWAQEMVPPTDEVLQSAEEWIENLVPASKAVLLNGIRYALGHEAADVVYVLSSAEVDKSHHDSVLTGIRALNSREVAIHTIAVDPGPMGELLLRNIAESNHGDIVIKFFDELAARNACATGDPRWKSWRTNLVNEKSKQLSDTFKKQKLSIGGQIKIIDVMQREERQKENMWREERNCAQRLLIGAEVQRTGSQDRDAVRELERKTARTQSERVGGGFAYQTSELDLGLEHLFEHKSAIPWTANSDTVAAGPRLPSTGSTRGGARLPPSREGRPEALPPPEARVERPSSARTRKAQGRPPPNPWAPDAGRPSRPTSGQRRPSSGTRTASADRAAGVRAPSPSGKVAAPKPRKGGSLVRPPVAEKALQSPSGHAGPLTAPAPLVQVAVPTSTLERAWSF